MSAEVATDQSACGNRGYYVLYSPWNQTREGSAAGIRRIKFPESCHTTTVNPARRHRTRALGLQASRRHSRTRSGNRSEMLRNFNEPYLLTSKDLYFLECWATPGLIQTTFSMASPTDVIVLSTTTSQGHARKFADVIKILPGLGGDPLADDLAQNGVVQFVVLLDHPHLRHRTLQLVRNRCSALLAVYQRKKLVTGDQCGRSSHVGIN